MTNGISRGFGKGHIIPPPTPYLMTNLSVSPKALSPGASNRPHLQPLVDGLCSDFAIIRLKASGLKEQK